MNRSYDIRFNESSDRVFDGLVEEVAYHVNGHGVVGNGALLDRPDHGDVVLIRFALYIPGHAAYGVYFAAAFNGNNRRLVDHKPLLLYTYSDAG